MKRLLIAFFMLAAATPAFASDCWNNAAGTQTNCAQVPVFLNGSNQTVPVSATNPLPITTGGGGSAVAVTQSTIPWISQLASGGTMDAAGFNAAFPGNQLIIGGVYNSAPPTLTTGNASPFLLDANGNLQIASPSLLAAIAAPLTPCTTSNCSGENPIGPVLISGTLPAFAATPTVNLGTIGTAATAANQPTNAAQGAAIAGVTGNMPQAESLSGPPTYVTATVNPVVSDLAGQLRIGNGSFTVTPNIGTPNVTNVSHAPGTVLGTRNGAVTAAIQFLKTGDAGEVNRLIVNSTSSGVTVGLKAYFFQSAPSTSITEAAALTLSAADIVKILDVEDLSPPDSTIGGTIWKTPATLRIPIGNAVGMYVILVVTGSASFTPVANSISMFVEGRY